LACIMAPKTSFSAARRSTAGEDVVGGMPALLQVVGRAAHLVDRVVKGGEGK